MVQFDTVISPCVSICRLDKDDVCMGCYRTVDEIRKWYEPNTTNEDRKQFLENIKQRKRGKVNGNAGIERILQTL